MKKMTKTLVLLFLLGLTMPSCAVVDLLLMFEKPKDVVENLSLDSNWSCNWLGTTVVAGTVHSRYNRTVSSVVVRVEIYDRASRLLEREDITISCDIKAYGMASFRERMCTRSNAIGSVEAKIIDAAVY